MLAASAQYRAALPFPHRRETRVEVYHGGVRVADDLPIVEGTVTASLTSRVTRHLSLRVLPELWPFLDTDLLSPTRAVLKVSTGIGYPDGSREIFPVFTGRVAAIQRDASGTVTLEGTDLAQDVIDFRFEQPRASSVGSFVTAQIQALISEALPSAVFGTDDVIQTTVPSLLWDEDRGQALDDLAAGVQGRWYALGDGSFVTRQYPYGVLTPVASLYDGQPTSGLPGTLMGAVVTKSRAGVYNSITVESERADGTNPVRVTSRDLGATSSTNFNGLYGKVSKVIKLQTPLSSAVAQQVAVAELTTSIALKEQWSVTCVPDATLEPADTLSLSYRGLSTVQVADAIEYPLTTAGAMSIRCRATAVTQNTM